MGAHDELGYFNPDPNETQLLRNKLGFGMIPQGKKIESKGRNWQQRIAQKILENSKYVEELGVPIDMKDTTWTVTIKNRKIDFHLSSNTWYSHSKQKYGTGIQELCHQMKKHI